MAEKFSLGFDLLTRDQIEASITGNPFVEKNRLILRLDMAARSDELKAKLDLGDRRSAALEQTEAFRGIQGQSGVE